MPGVRRAARLALLATAVGLSAMAVVTPLDAGPQLVVGAVVLAFALLAT